MGTPEFSVPTLQALNAAGHDIVACYSQPPRPGGRRGLEPVPSPVHKAALALNIPVFTPTDFKRTEEQETFAGHHADVAVVVAYGLLLPASILQAPKHGCYNGHASLLPRWRGAAPIHRAIMAGDTETGVMVMKMEQGLDTGPVAATTRTGIATSTSTGALHDTLSEACASLMVTAMDDLASDRLTLTPQAHEGVTYARKISKQETRIDWTQQAEQVLRHILGLSPFPGGWCEMPLGGKVQRVKILDARMGPGADGADAGTVLDDQLTIACGDNRSIRLQRLQRAGSKAMERDEFIRGSALPVGTALA